MSNIQTNYNVQEEKVTFRKLTWKESLKSIGPGIIFLLTGLGAGIWSILP